MVGRIYQLPIIVDYDMDCRGQLYFCVKICAWIQSMDGVLTKNIK